MKYLLMPDKCYHEALEQYFENPATYTTRGGCEENCSFCNGDYKRFTGPISKEHLIGALQANIFDRGAVRADKLVTFLSDKKNTSKLKKSIWGEKGSASTGQIHALVLKLFASNLLELRVSNPDLVGTKNLLAKDVMVVLSKLTVTDINGEQFDKLRIHDKNEWAGFQFRSSVPRDTDLRRTS